MDPDLTIRIDAKSPVPVYRQIADSLRALIVEGKLKPGDKLLTVRELAIELIIHHNTVAQAYRELATEGWLELVRRRGAIVRDRAMPRPTKEVKEGFARRLRELVAKAEADGVDRKSISDILKVYQLKEKKA